MDVQVNLSTLCNIRSLKTVTMMACTNGFAREPINYCTIRGLDIVTNEFARKLINYIYQKRANNSNNNDMHQ